MKKTKIIVIRDTQNQGKSTTIWLLLKELLAQGAKVKELYNLNEDHDIEIPQEMPPQGFIYDIWAVLEWHERIIVLDSRGDYVRYLEADVRSAIKNCDPDFIVCAVQERPGYNNIWNNFNYKFPNTKYGRICFWVERSENEADSHLVKQPTIEAIMKYMI